MSRVLLDTCGMTSTSVIGSAAASAHPRAARMIPAQVRIFVCTERQDMRRSFDALALAVRERLALDPESGALFVFASTDDPLCRSPSEIEIDLTHAHIWDASAVAAVDRAILKLRARGAQVHLSAVNESSSALLGQLAVHDLPGAAAASSH